MGSGLSCSGSGRNAVSGYCALVEMVCRMGRSALNLGQPFGLFGQNVLHLRHVGEVSDAGRA